MIKIPDKYYVGVRARDEDDVKEIPLGFATPNTGDAAFLKRKATVDNWTGSAKGTRFETFDNVLVEGFRISQSVRRYGWNGGGNVLWRIEDPRGFELEISSANFASIVDCATIDKGVISGKCVWGREGAINILLPEASEPYQEAVVFTDLSKKTVGAKELVAGQFVRMKDDTVAMYCGSYHGFGIDLDADYKPSYSYGYSNNTREPQYVYTLTPKLLAKRHVFLKEAAADIYSKTGVFELFEPHPDLGDDYPQNTMFSYSDVKNVAEQLDRVVAVDIEKLQTAILNYPGSSYSDIVFSHKASAMAIKAFKKVEFKVVDGETPGSVRLYEDPQGVLHHICEQNFHDVQHSRHSQMPKADRELYFYAYPLSLPQLVLKQTQRHTISRIRGVSKHHFDTWAPKTLIAVIDGKIEVPVRSYNYNHEEGKPMTETSVTKSTSKY